MINAAIVGLGWWGKTLVESLAEGSDVMRFVALTTRTISPEVANYAAQHRLHFGQAARAQSGDFVLVPCHHAFAFLEGFDTANLAVMFIFVLCGTILFNANPIRV
jgi:hypothetical protein